MLDQQGKFASPRIILNAHAFGGDSKPQKKDNNKVQYELKKEIYHGRRLYPQGEGIIPRRK